MRFFYADPGLRNNLGHHANSCRAIVNELRCRGIGVEVFGFAGMDKALQTELAAVPHFRLYTYRRTDGDPISGWLNFFQLGTAVTQEDLAKLPDVAANDLLYVNSARPIQLMALISWVISLPKDRSPQIVLEFATAPGLDVVFTPSGPELHLKDPRVNANAVLYRFAAKHLQRLDLSRFHMATGAARNVVGIDAAGSPAT